MLVLYDEKEEINNIILEGEEEEIIYALAKLKNLQWPII